MWCQLWHLLSHVFGRLRLQILLWLDIYLFIPLRGASQWSDPKQSVPSTGVTNENFKLSSVVLIGYYQRRNTPVGIYVGSLYSIHYLWNDRNALLEAQNMRRYPEHGEYQPHSGATSSSSSLTLGAFSSMTTTQQIRPLTLYILRSLSHLASISIYREFVSGILEAI